MSHRTALVGILILTLVLTLTACGGTTSEAQSPPEPAGDAQQVAAGKTLFEVRCQACHGVEGVGERPEDPMSVDPNGMPFAPALDDSMHAWHHSDEGLVATILNGSPRNPRMAAWSQTGLTEAEAATIVVYMKSLWGEVALRCQGALHMDQACIQGTR